MSSAKDFVPPYRKRTLSELESESESESPPQPSPKQPKLGKHQPNRPPRSFWDNLSRQWLTPRTLREIDRRAPRPVAPVPRYRTSRGRIDGAELQRFARHGGPDLSDIRGYPNPTTSMHSNQAGSRKRARTARGSGTSSSTRRSSAYDPAFEQHLIDHGIYPEEYSNIEDVQEPLNLDEINARLALPRQSLSPSRFTRQDFLGFRKTNREALTESKVMSKSFPVIAGTVDPASQENLRFGNLKDLTDGSITKAQPDVYDGARPEDLDQHVRQELGPYIIPSTNTATPCLPNFFAEGKGPKGLADVNKLQAMYDGALGERGMLQLSSFVNPEAIPYKTAHTITSTYHGGTGDLTIYSTHATESQSPQHPVEYHMIQLNGWKMTGNPDAFRQGASALRNARDWAKERRQELIATANAKAMTSNHADPPSTMQSYTSASSNEQARVESETSADELALGIDISTASIHSTPAQARTKRLRSTSSNRPSKV